MRRGVTSASGLTSGRDWAWIKQDAEERNRLTPAPGSLWTGRSTRSRRVFSRSRVAAPSANGRATAAGRQVLGCSVRPRYAADMRARPSVVVSIVGACLLLQLTQCSADACVDCSAGALLDAGADRAASGDAAIPEQRIPGLVAIPG